MAWPPSVAVAVLIDNLDLAGGGGLDFRGREGIWRVLPGNQHDSLVGIMPPEPGGGSDSESSVAVVEHPEVGGRLHRSEPCFRASALLINDTAFGDFSVLVARVDFRRQCGVIERWRNR